MKIERVETGHYRIPLATPIQTASTGVMTGSSEGSNRKCGRTLEISI